MVLSHLENRSGIDPLIRHSVVYSDFKLYWRWEFEDPPWYKSFSNKLGAVKGMTW